MKGRQFGEKGFVEICHVESQTQLIVLLAILQQNRWTFGLEDPIASNIVKVLS
jgi:hypothetical protein